jgi:hypothetical protein
VKSISGVLWFVVLVALMHALRDIYGPLLRRRLVKFAVAPGIVVFLFFKILTCYVAGARIREIKPFDDKAELLQYERPSLGAFGEFLICVLPLACLLLAFALAFTVFPVRGMTIFPLPYLPLLWQNPGAFGRGGWVFLSGFFRESAGAAGQVTFWLLMYASINTLLAGAPSMRELKYVAVGVVLGALAMIGIEASGLRVGSPQVRSFVTRFVVSFHFLFGAGVLWVAISVITVGAWRLFGQNRNERK